MSAVPRLTASPRGLPCRRSLLLAGLAALQAPPFAAGQMLVATPALRDPDFARSVILLFSVTPEAAMGLMLNRPLPRRAGEPQMYAGGPVAQGVRSLTPEAADPSATRLCPGVWLVPGQTKSPKGRIYLGYTGWTAAQLRQEWLRGLWRILDGDAAAVFDPRPEQLWQRLAAQAR
ncbi:MAG: YqgE/AlgH family protein [Bryobacteraceae bacterium]|nr:YqgE/AlgH family protein [Bryobacteraceae bacterium]